MLQQSSTSNWNIQTWIKIIIHPHRRSLDDHTESSIHRGKKSSLRSIPSPGTVLQFILPSSPSSPGTNAAIPCLTLNLITPRTSTIRIIVSRCLRKSTSLKILRSVTRVTTFTYCRLTTYHVGSRCFCNAPEGRFPRSRGEERRGEEKGRNRATARHNARCNREQKPNWRRREGSGWRWKREDWSISITRSAWKRLTQRRARCAGIGVLYQTALHGSHASRTYLTDIKSTTTRFAYARRLLFPLVPTTPLPSFPLAPPRSNQIFTDSNCFRDCV